MLRIILTSVLILASAGAAGGEKQMAAATSVSLAELAAEADAVVLAQVRDTDYIYRRGLPVAGSAFLKVLIPYRLDQAVDMIEIHEQGLHAHECYFPNPAVFQEGPRYLLFLKKDGDHPARYRGLARGCALDVLVDSDNRYVLRLPVTGIHLSDRLDDIARKFEFADRYALAENDALPSQHRKAWLAAGWIERSGKHYVFTRGVALSTVRELMGEFDVSVKGARRYVDKTPAPAQTEFRQ